MGLDDGSGSNPTMIIVSVVGLLLAGVGGFIYYADQQRKALRGETQDEAVSHTAHTHTPQPSSRLSSLPLIRRAVVLVCCRCVALHVWLSRRSVCRRRSRRKKRAPTVHSSQVSTHSTLTARTPPIPHTDRPAQPDLSHCGRGHSLLTRFFHRRVGADVLLRSGLIKLVHHQRSQSSTTPLPAPLRRQTTSTIASNVCTLDRDNEYLCRKTHRKSSAAQQHTVH